MQTAMPSNRNLSPNPAVDEFLRQEGLTDEEWKRIYDLRYCTILVPFADSPSKEKNEQDQKEIFDESEAEEPRAITPVSTPKSKAQRQMPTPKSAQPPRPSSSSLKPGLLNTQSTSPSHIGLLTPPQSRSAGVPIIHLPEKQDLEVGDSILTASDPLASYLTAVRVGPSHTRRTAFGGSMIVTTPTVDDEDMDTAEPETFHDALDTDEETKTGSYLQQMDIQDEISESSHAGVKRRHWELEPSSHLLQQRQPSSSKRVAITTSKTVSTSVVMTTGLLKPKGFSPPSTPAIMYRRGSTASDVSTASYASFAQRALWTTQDWKALEKIYNEMEGSSMAEKDLNSIADHFLAEQEAKTGEKPQWTREKVLTRCIALYRVRNDLHREPARHERESTPLSRRLRETGRNLNRPYPLHGSRLPSPSPADRTSSSAISDFLNQRRADRNHKQRDADQNYQLKSVFKHRLGSGLKTVRQLLPFWRDVEKGDADIKEKVAVPLVPAGKAQAVIAAFETQCHDSEIAGSTFSRSDSVVSSCGVSRERTGSPPVSGAAETVAEMLARGHSVRSASASSPGSQA
ncbi:hypothetical protein BC939DRAFT_438144 [Gamsiella multidivaricata]|uniref:uncharacterized protein n=1 Tax=Gamsiella multidivaricata TaxID=101098 RepID=UPI002220FC4F|nr:uncharacterized protein BC939DRAFT_438144 [Gamsiella multidivaricata]KAI7831288.1 hypothetical protein BC939DRAFT_438144 [Gamsiella multidivaricata]